MQKANTRITGLILLGMGLILTGVAALVIFPLGQAGGNSAMAGVEFSALPAKVRYEAPDLALNDLQGNRRSLSGYRGQVVLVNLWATWCPPCKAEMPNLQAFYERHREEGFVVIAIDDGDPARDVIAFVQEHHLTFPVWLDPTYEATERAFKSMNLPSSYVIDRGGTVRLAWVGAISPTNLEKYAAPLIEE